MGAPGLTCLLEPPLLPACSTQMPTACKSVSPAHYIQVSFSTKLQTLAPICVPSYHLHLGVYLMPQIQESQMNSCSSPQKPASHIAFPVSDESKFFRQLRSKIFPQLVSVIQAVSNPYLHSLKIYPKSKLLITSAATCPNHEIRAIICQPKPCFWPCPIRDYSQHDSQTDPFTA